MFKYEDNYGVHILTVSPGGRERNCCVMNKKQYVEGEVEILASFATLIARPNHTRSVGGHQIVVFKR